MKYRMIMIEGKTLLQERHWWGWKTIHELSLAMFRNDAVMYRKAIIGLALDYHLVGEVPFGQAVA